MKHSKQLRLLLGIPAILCTLMSATPKEKTEERPILISHVPAELPGAPRSDSSVSIRAYYVTDLCCVNVTLSNAGTLVDVVIENLDTAETFAYQISGNGSSVLPISGTSGNWTIVFALDTGDRYIGELYI